ncbi:hypothetical protein, partial [Staphylococcus pseudintermedius]|uniref:hypothetical protein n=1 Tax=Staphylococcus pseudintermedius TaxID=283734 RepID=UPI0036F43A92
VFASDFLQIPLRNGHPCLSLTVPTTKPVTDFHRQDVTHAGRTIKNALNNKIALLNALSSHQPTLTKNLKIKRYQKGSFRQSKSLNHAYSAYPILPSISI